MLEVIYLATTANNNIDTIGFLDATVPMRTEAATTVEILCRRLDHHAEPADDRDRHSFLTPMRLNSSSHSSGELEALVDYFTEKTKGNRNSSQTEGLNETLPPTDDQVAPDCRPATNPTRRPTS